MSNDSRQALDTQLQELVLRTQQYSHTAKGRRIALTQLVNAIWRSGKLCRPYRGQFQLAYEDIYEEAVQNLFFYLCRDNNINNYNPERGEVMAWVNMLLTKRFFPEAIPKIIGKQNEINLKSCHLENLTLSEPVSLFEQVRQYIEEDPERIFTREHIKERPEAKFQAIARRRYSGVSWQAISAEWEIGITTLHNFYLRCLKKFAPEIRKYIQITN